MFNTVTSGDIQPLKNNLFENQNKIRKCWVGMVSGSDLERRISTYPKTERFNLYSGVDRAILLEHTRLLREYKETKIQEGLVSGKSVLGCKILDKSAQIDTDSYIITATNNVLSELDKNLEEFKENI